MDSFTFNKIAGAVLTACIVMFLANEISHVVSKPVVLSEDAYPIEVAETGAAAVEEVVLSLPELLAMADASRGERQARKCAGCHTFNQGGATKTGPNLYDIINNDKGHIADFAYSSALLEMGGLWTYENMDAFIANPRQYMPGTKMSYAGLRNPEQRADLLAYMQTLSATPVPFPTIGQ